MFAIERYQSIVERVTGKGKVSVADLADYLSVTPETIRRDLSTLEQKGLLRRVHGGAVGFNLVAFEPSIDERDAAFRSEKIRIAEVAAREISDKATVIIDSGTSARFLIYSLPKNIEIQVITNSPSHVQLLSRYKNIQVIFLGGKFKKSTSSCVGTWTVEALSRVNADMVFIGANGVSISRGLTTPDQNEADVKKAMLDAGFRKILLADSSKFSLTQFSTFAQLRELDLIISDTALSRSIAEQVEIIGPKLVLA